MKKNFKIVVPLGLLGLTSLGVAQGERHVKPISPELLEKVDRANKAINRGDECLARGAFTEAIREYRIALEIETTLPEGGSSSAAYQLAKAYQKQGSLKEAMGAFSKAVKWKKKWGDWSVNGPVATLVALDYAVLAAKVGDHGKAKEMYYFGLRTWNPYGEKDFEPFPFLVVFDPEPGMDVWEYSEDALVTAATMVKATISNAECVPLVKQVRSRNPNWLVPVVFLATFGSTEESAQLYAAALAMAKTAEERELIEKTIGKERIDMTGANRRQTSVVIQDMETRNRRKKEFESKATSPGAPGQH